MSDVIPSTNVLATNRTQMGLDWTVLAYERTMMAWIRTSLSLISFGFTIFKFLETMQKTAPGGIQKTLHIIWDLS